MYTCFYASKVTKIGWLVGWLCICISIGGFSARTPEHASVFVFVDVSAFLCPAAAIVCVC